MKKQEIFNIVWTGMESQDFERSGLEVCAYRGPNGLKCAIGHLIPDELYDSSMEGTAARHLIFHLFPAALAKSLRDNVSMLTELQHIHDQNLNACGVMKDLVKYAMEHGLTIPLRV